MKGLINIALFAVYAALNVTGVFIVKANLGRAVASWKTVPDWNAASVAALGGALYIFSFLVWMALLVRMELTVAYPIAFGLSLAGTAAVGSMFLGEQISALRVAGFVLVFAGVIAISRS